MQKAETESKIKVLLTGGHAATTAIATVEEILATKKSWEIYWVGPKKAIEGKDVLTSSAKILPKFGVYFHPIIAGRVQKRWTRWTIPSLLKIPVGFIHALVILLKIQPKVILSFGGYAAFPIVVVGWGLGIPVVVHSQTVAVGLSNKLSSFFAKKVAVPRDESLNLVSRKKAVLVGNPVMSSIAKIQPKKAISGLPTIYITGGSTGAQRVNKVIDLALETILARFRVIHQTGELDFDYFFKRKENLPSELSDRYEVISFIEPLEVYKVFERADILISRSGANTVSEVMITGRPAIFIPIPWTIFDEQGKNARAAEKTGVAIVIPEEELTPEFLIKKLEFVVNNWKKMSTSIDKSIKKLDLNASKKLVELVQLQLK